MTKPTKADVARQFGRQSHAYATSPGHARGSDLQLLIGLLDLRPDMDALDVATGAGHTALAIAQHVRTVTAIDLAAPMIEQTRRLATERGITNLRTQVMDCEVLEFPDGSFDVVTCRIAPHHFLDLDRAIREIARVLRPSGQFGLEDSCAPQESELDSFINRIEKLRDPTHVRSHTETEWRATLTSAGLGVVATQFYRKTQVIADWIEIAGIDRPSAVRVYAAIDGATESARRHFEIEFEHGRALKFTDDKLLLRADKRG